MNSETFFEEMPFADLLSAEVTQTADGHAKGYLERGEELTGTVDWLMAHGGATFTLADTVWRCSDLDEHDGTTGGDVEDARDRDAGTIDPCTGADVVRVSGDVGTVDVEEYAAEDDALIGGARGVYKTGNFTPVLEGRKVGFFT